MSKIPGDTVFARPIEVVVTHSFEDAFRRFKNLCQRERVVADYKARMSYEKPSEKKRRKRRESAERLFLQQLREKMIENGEWEKRKRNKEKKQAEKMAKRIKRQEELEIS